MGYNTYYYGEICLKSKRAIKIIKRLDKEGRYPFEDDFEEIEFVEGNIEGEAHLKINCSWKDYENDMEKVCLFVSILDKKARGVIECSGEEKDDVWRIIVDKGRAIREQGYIKYDEDTGEEFEDTEIKKRVYEITKDKKLLKEVIVENLK